MMQLLSAGGRRFKISFCQMQLGARDDLSFQNLRVKDDFDTLLKTTLGDYSCGFLIAFPTSF